MLCHSSDGEVNNGCLQGTVTWSLSTNFSLAITNVYLLAITNVYLCFNQLLVSFHHATTTKKVYRQENSLVYLLVDL